MGCKYAKHAFACLRTKTHFLVYLEPSLRTYLQMAANVVLFPVNEIKKLKLFKNVLYVTT